VVIRGSLPDRQFTAFYLGDGVLRAALSINRPKDILRARKLIRARHRPDPAKLADEDADLRTV
jgi:3-phenylpropionate/trans-cinnamate dioxygenase ferredoxin reductase subunit